MSYIVMLLLIVIVLFAIKLLSWQKRSLERLYGDTAGSQRGGAAA
jgi:hypothetical protein